MSHDRGFVRRIATKILEVNNGQISTYFGTFEDYVWSLQKGMLAERGENAVVAKKAQSNENENRSVSKEERERRKENQKQLRSVEKSIRKCEGESKTLNATISALSESLSTGTPHNIAQLGRELADAQKRLSALETEWMELLEQETALNAETQDSL